MDSFLRKSLKDRLKSRIGEMCPELVLEKPGPSPDCLVFNLGIQNLHVVAGVGIASRLEKFWPIVGWNRIGMKLDLSVPRWPKATIMDLQMSRGLEYFRSESGVLRLDLLAGRPLRDYDVNISSVAKSDPEYKRWISRTTAVPTWQQIMLDRLNMYVDEVAFDICMTARPFGRVISGIHEEINAGSAQGHSE